MSDRDRKMSNPDLYPLRPFRIHDLELIADVVRLFPLAVVVSGDAGAHELTLLPLLWRSVDDDIRLIGHLDRNNPQAAGLVTDAPVSFMFQGPNAYASPDLYDDPHLPGWLYVSVKGRGRVTRRMERDETTTMLSHATTSFGDADQAFELHETDARIPRFIGGIVAFEILVTDVSCIAKLAQDKGPDHANRAAKFLAGHRTDGVEDLFARLLAARSAGARK